MKYLILVILLSGCAQGYSVQFNNPPKQDIPESGNFLYMELGSVCVKGVVSSDCYFQNETAARKVADLFNNLGVKHFMLPSSVHYVVGNSGYEVFADAVVRNGGTFMLQELYDWSEASFNCGAYKARRSEFLMSLHAKYGESFLGFSDDEPNYAVLNQNHLSLKACLAEIPAMASKIYLTNALPIVANQAQIDGPFETGYTLSDLGGCNNAPFSSSITNYYDDYLSRIFTTLKPDIVSFDLYPFTTEYDACPAMHQKLIQANLDALDRASVGTYKTTYLQNFNMTKDGVELIRIPSVSEIELQMRMSMDHGITRFALFLSHNTVRGGVYEMNGLLDGNNNPNQVYYNQLQANINVQQ